MSALLSGEEPAHNFLISCVFWIGLVNMEDQAPQEMPFE